MIGIGTMGGGQDVSRSDAITRDGKFLNEKARIRALFEN